MPRPQASQILFYRNRFFSEKIGEWHGDKATRLLDRKGAHLNILLLAMS